MLWLALFLTLAAVLRLWGLGEPPLWLDEIDALSSTAARRAEFANIAHAEILPGLPTYTDIPPETGVIEVWFGMAADPHPPVYFVLLHLWRKLASDDEWILRLPSVIFSIAAIALGSAILVQDRRSLAAIAFAAVLAMAYSHLLLAQNARGYSLGFLFTSGAYLLLWTTEQRWTHWGPASRWWAFAAYSACTYFAVMTHYFAALALAGHVPYALARFRGSLLRFWIGSTALAALCFGATWGPTVARQFEPLSAHTWIDTTEALHAGKTLLRTLDAPFRLLFVHEEFALRWEYAIAGAVACGAAIWLLLRRRSPAAVLFACWLATPLLLLAIIDAAAGKETLKHVRYIAVAVPGLAGALAMAFALLPRHGRWIAALVFGVAAGFTIRLPAPDNPDNRLAASLVASQIETDSLLVVDAAGWPPFWAQQIYHNVAYYLEPLVNGRRPSVLLLREPPSNELLHQIRRFKRVIVVTPRPEGVSPPLADGLLVLARSGYLHQLGWIYLLEAPGGD